MTFIVQRDERSAPFYDAAADNTLLIRRCPTCGQYFAPQQHACFDGSQLEWVASSGTGTLVSWIVDHVPGTHPLLVGPDGRSAVAAMVEVPEGPWINVALVDVDPATLRAGDPMVARFIKLGDESEFVPVFTSA